MPIGSPFWTTGIPRTPTPKDRAIRDLLARMQGKVGLVVGSLKVTQILTIRSATPELRFDEADQVDPAGRYRIFASGDRFTIHRAASAAWATSRMIFDYDNRDVGTSRLLQIQAPNYTDGLLRLYSGNGRAYVTISNDFHEWRTYDGIGSQVVRMTLTGGAVTSELDFAAADIDMNGRDIQSIGTLRGDGAGNLDIVGNRLATDPTAQKIALWALNPATDTQVQTARTAPMAATPLWTQLAPVAVPTTTELDATHLTFVVDGADQLTAYWNDAGTVRSLVIGTLL